MRLLVEDPYSSLATACGHLRLELEPRVAGAVRDRVRVVAATRVPLLAPLHDEAARLLWRLFLTFFWWGAHSLQLVLLNSDYLGVLALSHSARHLHGGVLLT